MIRDGIFSQQKLIFVRATHPDSCDWLRRSHITQYRCGYCKSQYHGGYYEGTLTLLWQKAEKLLVHMQKLQTTLIVSSTVLGLAVATVVRSRSGGIWMCRYQFEAKFIILQNTSSAKNFSFENNAAQGPFLLYRSHIHPYLCQNIQAIQCHNYK